MKPYNEQKNSKFPSNPLLQSIFIFYREKRSLYHSLCHSSIRFMQAGMTFNQVNEKAHSTRFG